ncbi:uncharacterized protein LOC143292454 [Babylonia areolata]|uniref:uncharacterized protein LOC143292454 n=1 Tax=Babylonia areolata TaxID=304850 RepID=UPI003FD31735
MSSPSAVQLYGTTKTYGRARESVASRSFDEMMSGKPAPSKASAAHTKWGNTNYVAVRDRKKPQMEAPKSREIKMQLDDPFSFDTDEKGKTSPTKVQPSSVTASYQRNTTRLPASRIFTRGKTDEGSASTVNPLQHDIEPVASSFGASYQRSTASFPAARVLFSQGKGDEGSGNTRNSGQHSSDSSTSLCAIARPGRTYTHSHEGRIRSSPTKQRLLDQFIDVGKTVKRDLDVLYSIESHKPVPSQMSPRYVSPSLSPHKSPQRQKVECSVSSSPVFDVDDSYGIFPPSYRSMVGSYTRDSHAHISTGSYDPPVKKLRMGTDSLGGRMADCRSVVAEDHPAQCKNVRACSDRTTGIFNSSVLSSQHFRGSKEVVSVPTSKSKGDIWEGKDSVNSQCLKKDSGERVWPKDGSSSSRLSISSSSSSVKLPASSQETHPVLSTPKQTAVINVDDENFFSYASTTGSRSVLSTKNHPAGDASKFVRDKSALQSSQSSAASALSVSSKPKSACSSSSSSNVSISSKIMSHSNSASASSRSSSAGCGNRRIQSGVKQYRIFKSRRPAQQSPPKEPEEEEDTSEDTAVNVSSPSMPELELELPEIFGRNKNREEMQNPPDITDDEKVNTDSAESSQTSLEDRLTAYDSQISQHAPEEPEPETMDVDEFMADSPALSSGHVYTPEAPSPASVDSQELSQDTLSADNSQKEEDVPVAPRRFFKSRKSSGASGLQRKVLRKSQSKASYNARSWHQDENDQEVDSTPPPRQHAKEIPFSDDDECPDSSVKEARIIRSVHWSRNKEQQAYTSVQVNKEHKGLYMVVKNVKMAHEVQESGETQDFIDDLEYLLDNLKDDQPVSIRALSTIQLAGKCILPAFRMHLRAHGTVTKIFSLLHDACSYPSLALSTAATMFMLSQDRLNMDLDKESLHLMLKLNEVDMPRSHREDPAHGDWAHGSSSEDSSELEKCRHRVQDLLLQLQKESTAAKQIDVDFVSTGNLAMESLLSLTSRRAGEWFKEELRTLGGLDHFVETVHHCVSGMKTDLARNLDKYTSGLKKLDRCLRVLENITFMNSDNQTYIIAYSQGLLITATGRILRQCVEALPMMPLHEAESETVLKQQKGWIIFECLLAVLRVLLNITHDCEFGCTRVGEEEGLLQTALQCVINIQWCVPLDQRFDVLVLSLGLLINLMEHCPLNRRHLVKSRLTAQIREHDYPTDVDAVQALVQLFLQRESAARQMEESPDTPVKASHSLNKSGEWRGSDSGIEWIARSAEKVRAAEKQRKDEAGEGSSRTGEKRGSDRERSGDGGSVQEDEENFTKALHKAGKHMENSIVASYVGLLLGCVIQDNRKYIEMVRKHLPAGSFDPMIQILKKFLGFMSLTTAIGTTDANSIQRVIDTLEAC